jgi:hypothetical protein
MSETPYKMSFNSLDIYTVRIILQYIGDIHTFEYISHMFKRKYPMFASEAKKLVKPTKVYLLWQYGTGKCDFPWFEALCFSTSLDRIEDYYKDALEIQPYENKFKRAQIEKYGSQFNDYKIIDEFRKKYFSENPLGDWELVGEQSEKQNSDVIKQVFTDLRNNRGGDYYNGYRRAGARWGYEIYTRAEVVYLYLNNPNCQELHVVFKHIDEYKYGYDKKLVACVETKQMVHDKFQHIYGDQINTFTTHGIVYDTDSSNNYEMHTFKRLN